MRLFKVCVWFYDGALVCVCVCALLLHTHTSAPGRFLAPSSALLKKIYSSVSPDDKLLAAEQILCSDVFTLQRVNSNLGSFGNGGRSRRKKRRVHVLNKRGGEMKSVFIQLSKE